MLRPSSFDFVQRQLLSEIYDLPFQLTVTPIGLTTSLRFTRYHWRKL